MLEKDKLLPLGLSKATRWQVSASKVDMTRPVPAPRPLSVMDKERELVVDVNRTAIIVIDMQNDFCHPDGWLASIGVDVSPARAPIAPLQNLLPVLRKAGVPVIWLNWGNRADKANLPPSTLHVYKPTGRETGIGDPLPNGTRVLEKDSWAAATVDELEIAPTDFCIDKFRMSGFQDTALDSVLRNLGVTSLLFAGVNADQCVLCTLQDANFLGYDCLLVEDCSATTSPQFCMDATLYNTRQCFGFVCSSSDILAGLS